jgi:hypothetical protein
MEKFASKVPLASLAGEPPDAVWCAVDSAVAPACAARGDPPSRAQVQPRARAAAP